MRTEWAGGLGLCKGSGRWKRKDLPPFLRVLPWPSVAWDVLPFSTQDLKPGPNYSVPISLNPKSVRGLKTLLAEPSLHLGDTEVGMSPQAWMC